MTSSDCLLQILKLQPLVNKHTRRDALMDEFSVASLDSCSVFLCQAKTNICIRQNLGTQSNPVRQDNLHLPAFSFLNGFGFLRSFSQAWQRAVQALVEAGGKAASNSINALTYSARPSIASSHFRTNVSAAKYLRFHDKIQYLITSTHFGNFPPIVIPKMVIKRVTSRTWAHLFCARSHRVGFRPATFRGLAVGPPNKRTKVERVIGLTL